MSIKNLDRNKYKVKEVIQSYLSLEKRGSNYWALCPFHDDSRASLSVSEERNIFKCFSCGVAGDAISFIMRREKLDFNDAILKAHEILKLPTDELKFMKKISPEEELKNNFLKFNKFMLDFYTFSLASPRGADALNYLKKERKLNDEVISHFGLGYSPAASEVIETLNNIHKVSPEYKFLTQEFLLQTGQFHLTGDKLSHNFKDKIILPIYNSAGKVLSFSARAIKDIENEPRYLHSKETLIFKKSECLYNLQELQKVKKDSLIYLFEGFFDVFAAYSLNPEGIFLALLGSQMSDDGFKLLSTLPSKKLVLALDNDDAGRDAAFKLFKKSLIYGLEVFALPPLPKKDLAESYQKRNSFKIPEPIPMSEWIKLNWSKLFPGEKSENKLPFINQLVLSLLEILFYSSSSGNQLFLRSNISPINAVSSLDQIFQFYEIVELSEKEKEILKGFKSKYSEVINLHLLSTNVLDSSIFEEKIENEKKPDSLVSNFSNILESWTKIVKFHSTSIFLQTRRVQWESLLLVKYLSKLQLSLSSEEKDFLKNITKTIDQLSNSLTPMKSSGSLQECISEIFNFLELYYQLIHQLIDNYEVLVKQGPVINLSERIKVLNEIDRNRRELSAQASKVFKEVIQWEKQKENSKNRVKISHKS